VQVRAHMLSIIVRMSFTDDELSTLTLSTNLDERLI
jgi:hypothetical protein